VTWTSGTPLRYPETWFWLNHSEAVMALTYEDKNCLSAGNYDRTADALLRGVIDYIGLEPTTDVADGDHKPGFFSLEQNYPNPFNSRTTIRYSLANDSQVEVRIYNLRGEEVETVLRGFKSAGVYDFVWDTQDLPTGVYVYQLKAGAANGNANSLYTEARKLMLLK
jgi:hypothetical protein